VLDVTDEQRSRRPIFIATLWAGASWLFFRVARSTRMTQIWALRSRLEKQPTDLRQKACYFGDRTLVYDGLAAVGWCQFGPTDELPRIKNKRGYLDGLTNLPDWRITCFFVDRDYRGKGMASVALKGALREISRLGGGTVESYPEDVEGRSVSASFLHNGTVSMFEREVLLHAGAVLSA
jgi:GNAT superfamily N-acetyltransferase